MSEISETVHEQQKSDSPFPAGRDEPGQYQSVAVLALSALYLALFLGVYYTTKHLFTKQTIGVDDANIFFTYAKNLTEGHGLVWAPGGERVEGFTSPLWLLVCYLAFFLTASPESLLIGISLFLLAASSAAYFIAFAGVPLSDKEQSLLNSPHLVSLFFLFLIFPAWLIVSPGYVSWMFMSIMDTALWSATIMLTIVLTYWKISYPDFRLVRFAYPVILAVLYLIRPEGLGIALASLACVVLGLRSNGQSWSTVSRTLLLPFFVLLNTFLVLLIFRLVYFGYPLPNTYYAKVGNNFLYNLQEGGSYLLRYLSIFPTAALALFAALSFAIWWLCKAFRVFSSDSPLSGASLDVWCGTNCIIYLAGIFIYVIVGGDHFPLSRQYQAFWPCTYMITAACIALLLKPISKLVPRTTIMMIGLMVVLLFTMMPLWQAPDKMRLEFSLAEMGRAAGETLNDLFPGRRKPTVGAIAVGGIGFTYQGPLVDLMGINNIEMAHSSRERFGQKNHAAFNREVFYRQAPDYIIHFGDSCGPERDIAEQAWMRMVLKDVPIQPKFQELYVPVLISSRKPALREKGLCGWAKKSFIESRPAVPGQKILPRYEQQARDFM